MTPNGMRTLAPGAVLNDATVRGLQLRAFPKGKGFYLYYRTREGRQRRPKIGDWPTLSLAQAREIARGMLARVAAGEDPAGEKVAARTAPTMRALWERYWIDHGQAKKSGSNDARLWAKYLSKLGGLDVSAVGYAEVKALHAGMASLPVQANRVLALLSTLLNHGERLGWRPAGSNPVRLVDRYRERRRARYMRPEEAGRVMAALAAREAQHPLPVAFLYLLILTGARKGELAGARWDQLADGKLVLQEHKTARAGEDRVVFLPRAAADILAGLPRRGELIFSGANPRAVWDAVRIEAGCPDLRLHDLRHSFASAGVSAGLSLAEIGGLLGHRSAQTTKRYAHLADEAAHAAVARTAEAIGQSLGGHAFGLLEGAQAADAQHAADHGPQQVDVHLGR